jgi:hypothetical protein
MVTRKEKIEEGEGYGENDCYISLSIHNRKGRILKLLLYKGCKVYLFLNISAINVTDSHPK